MSVHDNAIAAYLGAIKFGENYLDSKSNYHGLLVGSPSWLVDTDTIDRPYLRFDGSFSTYANTAFASRPSPGSFSVHLWVRVYYATGTQSLGSVFVTTGMVAPHISGGMYVNVSLANSTSFRVGMILGVGGSYTYAPGSLAYGNWLSIGAYYDYDAERAGFYLNGSRAVDIPAVNLLAMTNLLIARGGSNSTLSKPIDVADASMWDRVLTPAEFATLANPRYTPLAPPASRPRILSPYLIGDAG